MAMRRRTERAGARIGGVRAAPITLMMLLAGCAPFPERGPMDSASGEYAAAIPPGNGIAGRLEQQVARWRGTPYRYGGLSRSGIDCSGFVLLTYRRTFGVELPRTTESQALVGTAVARGELRTGDLVFFRTGAKQRHVGIVTRGKRFVHASTSRGVTVSRLDNRYWRRHFWKATRPLAD